MGVNYDPSRPLDDDTRMRLLERNRWQEVEENDRRFADTQQDPPAPDDPEEPHTDEDPEFTPMITPPPPVVDDVPGAVEGGDPASSESDQGEPDTGTEEGDKPDEDEEPEDEADEMMKPELKAELDRLGVKYRSNARKPELVALLRAEQEKAE